MQAPSHALSQTLKQLVQEAKAVPIEHWKRQRYLSEIYTIVTQSGKLWQEHTPNYGDAVNDMWEYCFHSLDDYDPNVKEVITWLNDVLRLRLRRYRDRQARDNKRHVTHLIGNDGQLTDIVDTLPDSSDAHQAWKTIIDPVLSWVEADPEHLLRDRKFPQCPEINAQILLLRRLPPQSKSWSEIVAEFGLSGPTSKQIPKWYSRYCNRFLKDFAHQEGLR